MALKKILNECEVYLTLVMNSRPKFVDKPYNMSEEGVKQLTKGVQALKVAIETMDGRIDKRLSSIERRLDNIGDRVSHENAAQFPSVRKKVASKH